MIRHLLLSTRSKRIGFVAALVTLSLAGHALVIGRLGDLTTERGLAVQPAGLDVTWVELRSAPETVKALPSAPPPEHVNVKPPRPEHRGAARPAAAQPPAVQIAASLPSAVPPSAQSAQAVVAPSDRTVDSDAVPYATDGSASLDRAAGLETDAAFGQVDVQRRAAPQPAPPSAPSTTIASTPSDSAGSVSGGAASADESLSAAAGPELPRLPGSYAQRFRIYWGNFDDRQSVARVRHTVSVEGDRYELRTEGEAEGLISLVYSGTLTQVSTGVMGPEGLQPERYAEARGRRTERAVAFGLTPRQLRPDGAPAIPLPAGTQDRLSVFYQLGLMARADPSLFTAGQTVVVPVASLRDVREERFVVIGDETLLAPSGAIRALHLHRPPPSGSRDPKIDLWLGYDQQMLPVRLRVEDGSHRVLDQLVEPAG